MGCWIGVDLGATNARLLRLDERGQPQGPVERRRTADLGDGAEFGVLCRALSKGDSLSGVCVAVAGPVINGRTQMTNGRVELDAAALKAELGCPVLLCNDFFALAHAIDDFRRLRQVGGGPVNPTQMRAVLGPGSGLGMALCPPVTGNGQRQVIASEGGYGPLAPVSFEEAELCKLLFSLDDYLSWESVLSGPGLERLHRAVGMLHGRSPQWLPAAEITAGALAGDARCRATVDQFFAFLGSCAGGLAVTARASGGVYVGGGIVPRLASLAQGSVLRARFETRGRLSSFVANIPLFLVLDEEPGLLGTAVLVRETSANAETVG